MALLRLRGGFLIACRLGGAALMLSALQACGGGSSDTPVGPADLSPPTAPSALSAAAQSATQIQLSWQAATDNGTGVAGYRVFRGTSGTPIATVAGTSYLDTGLTAATPY